MLSTYLLATAGTFALASAACQLSNDYQGGPVDKTYKSPKLCVPQGAGSWTFSLYTSAVEVPTFDGEDPDAGYSDNNLYIMYDNACNVKGMYQTQSSCAIPFTIEENFLKDVLTITSENTAPGGADYVFTYGNGKFSMRNNHCGCQDMSSGLMGAQGCKCAFPVNGKV